ncbi:hypothetical protein J6S88_04830 [bacterium]|nr:hypothetical protein [bacterium]
MENIKVENGLLVNWTEHQIRPRLVEIQAPQRGAYNVATHTFSGDRQALVEALKAKYGVLTPEKLKAWTAEVGKEVAKKAPKP